MPLMHKKSNKAFEHNIKAEMMAGKPQKQSLAIAYDVKRRAKKASGGMVKSGSRDMDMARGGRLMKAEGGSISASNEKRPMPEDMHNDRMMADQNRGNKAPRNDAWTDNPTIKQAQNNNGRKVMPIKRPRMVPSDVFSARLYDKEGNLEESAKPGPYGAQPEAWENEEGANRQGPMVSDMADEHSTHMKPYKKEIEDQYAQDEAEDDMKRGYAKGGMIAESDRKSRNINMRTSMEPMDAPEEMYERRDQNNHMVEDSPSMDEGAMHARHLDEMDQDMSGNDVPDMADEHSTGRKPYAGGGRIGDVVENLDHEEEMNPAHGHYSADDSEMQPEDEEMEEKHNSIAAAIMAKKKAKEARMSDSDMDEMMRLYEGGEITKKSGKILSHDSIYSDDSDQADLRRNAQEDANEEDQLSFNALRKENYSTNYMDKNQPMDSNEHGDDEEMDSHDKHDMISSIRAKMKKQRQF